MRVLLLFLMSLFVFSACTQGMSPDEVDKRLFANVDGTMKARGLDVSLEIDRLAKLDKPEGFYFYKVKVRDNNRGISQDQFIFFNGEFMSSDFINATNNASMSRDLLFDHVLTEIDTAGLSLLSGTESAKNIIVKITDFQCPYCREANRYLEDKIAGRDDVAVYIAHYPLRIHPNAPACAKIFEAGLMMGKNFSHELFTNDELLELSEAELIEYFAKLSGDGEKLKSLMASEEVEAKLALGLATAEKLGVRSTPVIYINGKKVEGFDATLINKGIAEFK